MTKKTSQTDNQGNIKPPVQIGERWRKASKNKVSLSKIIREIKRPFAKLYAPIDIIFNRAPKLKQIEKEFPTVLSHHETIDLLINGASICRYGNAEFDCLRWQDSADRLSPEWKISKRVEEVLVTPSSEQLVIAIPSFNPKHGNPRKYGWLRFYQYYWSAHWDFLKERLTNRTFGNSFISRCAAFYEVDIEKFRSVWSGRDVVFVTGKDGRFFDEPRLFSNIKSAEYLFVEPKDAYKHYERTLLEALTFDKSRLFIICAGIMATVLAFDLYHQGYQALDMGHLPNCYREYLKEAPRPEWLPDIIAR